MYEREEIPLPFGFTGHSKEAIPGLYHAGAREYDSRRGRFLTRDQYRYMDYKDPVSLNLYQYAKGNPLRYVDYDGHMCIEEPSYMERTIDYVLKGNYTDDVTGLGVGLDVTLGLLGADLPMDIRDLTADFTVNFDPSDPFWWRTMALDLMALVPGLGIIKYVNDTKSSEGVLDEVGEVSKESADKNSALLKIIQEMLKESQKSLDIVKEAVKKEMASDSSGKKDTGNMDEKDQDVENVLLFPKPGDTITISRGIDLPDETAVVFVRNTWSREYSVDGCNKKYADTLCCRRLNYAIENYECNSTDNDLLMFNLEGYDKAVFAGAMVEGYADVGDIVQVTLDDNSSFYFLILDVKSTQHTSQELAPNNQCQWELGHGYLIDEDTVQLSVCEFITAGNCSEDNVQNTESGAFLKNRNVVKTQIIDHIQICD